MTSTKKSPDKAVTPFGDKDATLPAYMHTQTGGLGNEAVGSADLAIPRMSVLQALSPQVEEIKDAQPGLLYVSVTDALMASVYVLNLAYLREFAVFRKRNQGAGFIGAFDTEHAANARIEMLEGAPEHYEVIETAKHTLLLLDPEGRPTQPVQIFMTGTKLSVSRNWNTEIQLKGPKIDRFASVWRLATVQQQNSRGQKYFNLKVEFAGWAPEHTFYAARRAFYQVTGTTPPPTALASDAA